MLTLFLLSRIFYYSDLVTSSLLQGLSQPMSLWSNVFVSIKSQRKKLFYLILSEPDNFQQTYIYKLRILSLIWRWIKWTLRKNSKTAALVVPFRMQEVWVIVNYNPPLPLHTNIFTMIFTGQMKNDKKEILIKNKKL